MDKIKLIAKHEFWRLVKSKSFIIMTLVLIFLPLLAGGAIWGVVSFSGILKSQPCGYVDEAGVMTTIDEAGFARYESGDVARRALLAGEIGSYYVVPDDYMSSGEVFRYSGESGLLSVAGSIARDKVIKESLIVGLAQGNLPADIAERVEDPFNLKSVELDESGVASVSEVKVLPTFMGVIFGFIFLSIIMTSSGYLLAGLMNEKRNKVMELILSSVSSRGLLMGKVLGIGLAGLLQTVMWLVGSGVVVGLAYMAFMHIAGDDVAGNIMGIPMAGGIVGGISVGIPSEIAVVGQSLAPLVGFGIVYFVLGYFLVSLLLAGFGAVCNVEHQAHQWSAVLMFLMISPIMVAIILIDTPNNIILRWMSLVPLTSPIAMVIRLAGGGVAIWELATSIGLLALSIWLVLQVVSKLFKSGLLVSNKWVGWRNLMRLRVG